LNPDEIPAQEITRVTRLSEHDFRVLVDEDVRDRAQPITAAVLRSPTVVERWYESLLASQTSVAAQLAAKEAEFLAVIRPNDEVETTYQRWKAGAIRFKSGVDRKLIEARRLLREQGSLIVQPDPDQQALLRVALLEQAIRTHRYAVNTSNAEAPAEYDLELWSYVGK